jgi:hypothetical protein
MEVYPEMDCYKVGDTIRILSPFEPQTFWQKLFKRPRTLRKDLREKMDK